MINEKSIWQQRWIQLRRGGVLRIFSWVETSNHLERFWNAWMLKLSYFSLDYWRAKLILGLGFQFRFWLNFDITELTEQWELSSDETQTTVVLHFFKHKKYRNNTLSLILLQLLFRKLPNFIGMTGNMENAVLRGEPLDLSHWPVRMSLN